jgi:HEPN domain-containing protein
MNEEVDPHVEQAARWVRWASEDLVLARSAHADPDAVARGACTWAHQCAEKALKAMVVAQGIDPPKTHNLLQLEQLVSADLAETLAAVDLEALTRWSIEGRYPEDLEEATAADAAHAIETATAVLNAVQETLPPPTEAPGEDR